MNVRYPPSERQILVHANDRFWPIPDIKFYYTTIAIAPYGSKAVHPCPLLNSPVTNAGRHWLIKVQWHKPSMAVGNRHPCQLPTKFRAL